MTDQKKSENLGTQNYPVSYVHQRTVALLYDELSQPGKKEVHVRLSPDGELSQNLREGVDSVKIPGEWDSIGGITPDLICYGDDGDPIRIIEVVVTNPPNKAKRQKLDYLRKRGVDVVMVTVRNERDILDLCWERSTVDFNPLTPHDQSGGNIGMNQFRQVRKARHDGVVSELIGALLNCSPSKRRELVVVLRELQSLDSLFPLRPDNPLTDSLTTREMTEQPE
ncbi:MAG: hypothetical protein F4Y50_00580 [Dehalococcoidia bacterium]|nr:hypothetical protein [Dehalococcoidia bacterium]